MPSSETEHSDYYKRGAAIHEAGHATAGAALDCFGAARLWPNESGDAKEKLWCGRYEGPIGKLDQGAQAAVAVAGIVADHLAVFPECSAEDIMDVWEQDPDLLSPTDLELIPTGAGERLQAVREALCILREQRPLFERLVAHLVEHDLVTATDLLAMAWSLLRVIPERRAN
jgi:hypothetical protein